MILDFYLGNYISVRLQNKFIMAVCKPIIDFIDFFESRDIRVHYRYEKCVLLLRQHLSNWVKDGGSSDGSELTVDQMLSVKCNAAQKLSRKNVFLGTSAREFIQSIGLNSQSPELDEFFSSVFVFYETTTQVMIKYFTPTLKSQTMRYLQVLSPEAKNMSLDKLRNRWTYLAGKFPNVVPSSKVDDLRAELSIYTLLEDPEPNETVDGWFAKLAAMKVEGACRFPVLSNFGLALATIYNSSSEAERDFSKQSNIYDNSHVTKLSQGKLQAKLQVQSAVGMKSRSCERCLTTLEKKEELKRKGESVPPYKCYHCHCGLLVPGEGLMKEMRNGLPSQRYKVALQVTAASKEDIAKTREVAKKDHEKYYLGQVKTFKKLYANKMEDDAKAKKEQEKQLAGGKRKACNSITDNSSSGAKKKKQRETKKKEKEDSDKQKKQRLGFLFMK